MKRRKQEFLDEHAEMFMEALFNSDHQTFKTFNTLNSDAGIDGMRRNYGVLLFE